MLKLGPQLFRAPLPDSEGETIEHVRRVPACAVSRKAHLHDPRPDLFDGRVDRDRARRLPHRMRDELVPGQDGVRLLVRCSRTPADAMYQVGGRGRRRARHRQFDRAGSRSARTGGQHEEDAPPSDSLVHDHLHVALQVSLPSLASCPHQCERRSTLWTNPETVPRRKVGNRCVENTQWPRAVQNAAIG